MYVAGGELLRRAAVRLPRRCAWSNGSANQKQKEGYKFSVQGAGRRASTNLVADERAR